MKINTNEIVIQCPMGDVSLQDALLELIELIKSAQGDKKNATALLGDALQIAQELLVALT